MPGDKTQSLQCPSLGIEDPLNPGMCNRVLESEEPLDPYLTCGLYFEESLLMATKFKH